MPDRPLQAALPREMYVEPGTWLAERELALFGQWFCLGRTDDLGLEATSRVATVDVAGESVLVMRDAAGALHAAYNVCRHRGSQIRPTAGAADAAACDLSALRCPYHSWTYGLDGRLLRAPHTELTGVDLERFRLAPVGVDTWGGFVFVHLTPEGSTPLAEAVARADVTLKASLKGKRKYAGWDDAFMAALIAG